MTPPPGAPPSGPSPTEAARKKFEELALPEDAAPEVILAAMGKTNVPFFDLEFPPGTDAGVGKLVAARQVIRDGTKACPANEDVWLEAARLQTRENAKTVLAEAVKKIPQSVKIWLQAASLETKRGTEAHGMS